jgi:hypothetical protein
MVVRGGDDAAVREEEACDDGGTMCGEGDMLWFGIVDPSCTRKMSGFEKYFVRMRKWKGIRYECRSGCRLLD